MAREQMSSGQLRAISSVLQHLELDARNLMPCLQHLLLTQGGVLNHEAHWAVWDDYLAQQPDLASRVRGLASQHRFLEDPDLELTLNQGYAIAITAIWVLTQASEAELKTPEGWSHLQHRLAQACQADNALPPAKQQRPA